MHRTLALSLLLLVGPNEAAATLPANMTAGDSASTVVSQLIVESAGLRLPTRIERAFLLTLHAAADALREGDIASARTMLKTFAFEVRGVKRARRMPAATADPLIEQAEKLITAMSVRAPR